MNWKFAPLFITPVFFLYACGGSSSSSGGSGGGGGTTPQAISVSFPSGIPPATLNGGAQTPLEANVANDSANAGVTWSCTPAGSCGSFSPSTTTSGNPTTYTAPIGASAPTSVTVTATSVTDPTKNAHVTIAINAIAVQLAQAPPASLLIATTAQLAATVLNDSANAGVTWSCTPANSCGSFSPATTLSGNTATYTAPPSVPAGATVTIIATSITDTSKSVQASVTITSNITVTLSQPPPATLPTSGGHASITATVTNDSANAGVTWSCTPANSCGSFNPTSTPGGTPTSYTAPATTPTVGTVTVIATSVTDPSKSASASIVITGTASLSMLKGQYAFLIQAPTGLRGTTTWAGSINLDGSGNVIAVPNTTGSSTSACPNLPIAGMEDIVSFYQPGAMPPANYYDQADPIVPTGATVPVSNSLSVSQYTITSSGRGRLVFSTCNAEILGISFVLTSATHAEVIEADGPGGDGGDPASGTLDLQTTTTISQISGNYSFVLSGIDAASTTKLAVGGEFSTDGSGAVPTGAVDVMVMGSPVASYGMSSTGSKFDSLPDTNGRGTLHFVVAAANQSRTFIYYVISPKVLRLVESDSIADIGGSAYLQPPISPAAALSGSYVYQHSGWSSTGRTVAAGQFSATGSALSGISDSNAGAVSPTTATTAFATSGSFSVVASEEQTLSITLTEAAGTSTFYAYFVDPSINILDPNNSSGGGGALLLHTDTNINGVGILLPQATPARFAGGYALNLNNSIASTPNEVDLVGTLSADGVSSFGTANTADYDHNDSSTANPMIDAGLSGSFAPDTAHASTSRYTGSLTVAPPTTGTTYPFIPGSAFTVAIYPASNSQAFIVETDTKSSIIGRILEQILP